MKIPSMILSAVTLGFLGCVADAQPMNHIGDPLAQVMIEAGCTLTEEEAAEGLKAKGYGMSDLQAQVTALLNGQYLGSSSDGKWQLQGWPPCE